MKKLLKLTSLFIIAIGCLFVFNTSVFAAEGDACGDEEGCRLSDVRSGGRILASQSPNSVTVRALSASTPTTKQNIAYGYWDTYPNLVPYTQIGVTYVSNGTQKTGAGFERFQDSYTTLYCLDAGLAGHSNLFASRFLIDDGDGRVDKYTAMDYALMAILTSGDNSTEPAAYFAKALAIRATVIAFGSDIRAGADASDYNNIHWAVYGTISDWLNEDASTYNSIVANGISLRGLSEFSSQKNRGFYFSGSPVDQAQSYFNLGLEAALDYVMNGGGEAAVEDVTPTEPPVVETIEDATGSLVKADAYHNLNVGGFSSDDEEASFILSGIRFENDEEPSGLTTYYVSKIEYDGTTLAEYASKEEAEAMYGQNFLELFAGTDFSQEKEMIITVHFEGYESVNEGSTEETLDCGAQPMKYELYGTYKSSAMGAFGNYVGVIWYESSGTTQRFVSVEEGSSSEKSWVSEKELSMIDACDCDDLIEACVASGDWNSDECEELREADCGECAELEAQCGLGDDAACQEFAEKCEFECGTTFSNFDCCDADNLVISLDDNHPIYVYGPDDVVACFVNQVDGQFDPNTGYSEAEGVKDDAPEPNSYTTHQNKYCVVSCKEDYDMLMPTAKLVNAGRYFTFSAEVDGTKTCYTNTINIGDTSTEGSFVYDVAKAQEDMINAYNEYRKWQQLYEEQRIEEVPDQYVSSAECTYGVCGPVPDYTEYYPEWEAQGYVDDWQTITNIDPSTGVVTTQQGGQNVSDSNIYQQTINPSVFRCDGGSYTIPNTDTTGYCSGGSVVVWGGVETVTTKEEYIEILRGRMEEAKGALEAAKTHYENVIDEFAECTNDTWSSEMHYNTANDEGSEPYIYYDYAEDEYMAKINNIGDMVANLNSSHTDNGWFCVGELSDLEYEACAGNTSSSRDDTLVRRTYKVCEPEEGCYIEEREEYGWVSDADYAKKDSNVNVTYKPETLFYNVYPSGEIVTESAEDNVPLENSLPVSLSTPRGIYIYTLNFTSLGEYYEPERNGDPGRLVGNGNSSVINTGNSSYVSDDNTYQYMCNYLVNMGKVTTGDVVCDWDGCEDGDCTSNCVGPGCDDPCEGDDCVMDCIGAGCSYDVNGGQQFNERVVSLSNLFPNGTDAYNWTNEKGQATVEAIQDAGNSIYDEEPILSVTISPSTARQIETYNESAESVGGYSNATLSCYKIDNSQGLIACYSSFITDLMQNQYGDNVVNDRSLIWDVRTEGENDYDYFTLWTGTISENQMLGPSWK